MVLYGLAQTYAYTVAAPSSTNCERLPTQPGREGVLRVCASTEPAGTGIGDVCIERGGEAWTEKMLNHTRKPKHRHTEKLKEGTLPSCPSLYEEASKEKKAGFARAPRY